VALVGAGGYVGRALAASLERRPDVAVTPVTRATNAKARQGAYDVLINAAMPSRRFWAGEHPQDDFVETVEKTASLVYGWRFGKLVHISSVSARSQLDTVYGRHKAAAERLCAFGDNLIVRLGAMYSHDLSKGVLVDILQGRKVFVDGASRYCFAPLAFIAEWIAANLHRTGLVELGGQNAISLRDVAAAIGADVRFEGPVDHQEVENPEPGFPDARDVVTFMREARARQAAAR
jgi:dTDP-4-dehydrorhamnose reductase